MMDAGLKGYVLFGVEPELDCIDSAAATRAMESAEFVVAITAFAGDGLKASADVLLPVSTFLETAGSFINTEGHWQIFEGCVQAPGEARPAWKVLRVIGNLLDVPGFEYTSVEDVRSEMESLFSDVPMDSGSDWSIDALASLPQGLVRIADVPIYATDSMVRRAEPLQQTADAANACLLRANSYTLQQAGLVDGGQARVSQAGAETVVAVVADERVPDNAVYLPAGIVETQGLGASFSPLQLALA